MENIGNLFEVLMASEALIQRSAVRIIGREAPLPFRVELNTLRRKQYLLKQKLLEIQRWQSAQSPGNLGVVPLVIAAGAGAVLGISAIGGWIYAHFTDAKKIDAQTQVYQDLRDDGTDARNAANIVFGGSTDWGSVMKNVVLVSVIGAGIFVFAKVWK